MWIAWICDGSLDLTIVCCSFFGFHRKQHIMCIKMASRARSGGRQQVTDDTHDTIWGGVTIREAHTMMELKKTKKEESDVETRKGHRRKLNTLMTFWEKEYPDHCKVGTKQLTPDKIANEMLFCCPSRKTSREGIWSAKASTWMLFLLSWVPQSSGQNTFIHSYEKVS